MMKIGDTFEKYGKTYEVKPAILTRSSCRGCAFELETYQCGAAPACADNEGENLFIFKEVKNE